MAANVVYIGILVMENKLVFLIANTLVVGTNPICREAERSKEMSDTVIKQNKISRLRSNLIAALNDPAISIGVL